MNLEKLFNAQRELSNKILENNPDSKGEDLFDKKVLALLVELGECAQELRTWKFWSKDQDPRTKTECEECGGDKVKGLYDDVDCLCEDVKNPLLEEYVDGLHFVLEIGLEHGIDEHISGLAIEEIKFGTIERQFTALFKTDWELCDIGSGNYYHEGLELYISLGEMLGFAWEEIEEAYFQKNEINHARQDSGTY